MLVEGQRIGKYVIEGKIAEGGIAAIHLARFAENGSLPVAVKHYCSRKLDYEQMRKYFYATVSFLSQTEHPNIVRLYDFFEDSSGCYVVMEYLDGIDLQRFVKNNRTLDEKNALAVSYGTANALSHIHNKSLIHRDIKPGNIMVTRDGRTILIDFEFIRSIDQIERNPENVTGTIAYLAPEYLNPENTRNTPEGDIHAFGWTLHDILSGMPTGSIFDVVTRCYMLNEFQEDLSGFPIALSIAKKCVSLNPDERSSAQQLEEELRQYSGSVEIL